MPLYNIEDHHLLNEFPQYADRIETLWQHDPQFAQHADHYQTLNKQIHGLEMTGVPVSDHYFEDLKKRRVQLKDQIYSLLNDQRSRNDYSRR
jgi:hypothetical protein